MKSHTTPPTGSKFVEIKGVKALVREGTSDEFVVKEVMGGAYNKLTILPTDCVADIGLNIGIFSIWALRKGAREIHSYEPEPDNFRLAEYNLKLNGHSGASIHNVAVIGNEDKARDFSINTKKNKGAHSLVKKRGRETTTVKCININKILKSIRPNIIKMDIEGAEYECLKAIKSFDGVRELILEFHHAHLDDIPTHERYNEILALLRNNFSTVEARKDTKGAWVSLVYCKDAK